VGNPRDLLADLIPWKNDFRRRSTEVLRRFCLVRLYAGTGPCAPCLAARPFCKIGMRPYYKRFGHIILSEDVMSLRRATEDENALGVSPSLAMEGARGWLICRLASVPTTP
jgi:hypothetical protein